MKKLIFIVSMLLFLSNFATTNSFAEEGKKLILDPNHLYLLDVNDGNIFYVSPSDESNYFKFQKDSIVKIMTPPGVNKILVIEGEDIRLVDNSLEKEDIYLNPLTLSEDTIVIPLNEEEEQIHIENGKGVLYVTKFLSGAGPFSFELNENISNFEETETTTSSAIDIEIENFIDPYLNENDKIFNFSIEEDTSDVFLFNDNALELEVIVQDFYNEESFSFKDVPLSIRDNNIEDFDLISVFSEEEMSEFFSRDIIEDASPMKKFEDNRKSFPDFIPDYVSISKNKDNLENSKPILISRGYDATLEYDKSFRATYFNIRDFVKIEGNILKLEDMKEYPEFEGMDFVWDIEIKDFNWETVSKREITNEGGDIEIDGDIVVADLFLFQKYNNAYTGVVSDDLIINNSKFKNYSFIDQKRGDLYLEVYNYNNAFEPIYRKLINSGKRSFVIEKFKIISDYQHYVFTLETDRKPQDQFPTELDVKISGKENKTYQIGSIETEHLDENDGSVFTESVYYLDVEFDLEDNKFLESIDFIVDERVGYRLEPHYSEEYKDLISINYISLSDASIIVENDIKAPTNIYSTGENQRPSKIQIKIKIKDPATYAS